MRRSTLLTLGLGILAPGSLLAQSAPVCSGAGLVASVTIHSGEVIDGLSLWRGTSPADARTPEWREVTCVPGEAEGPGAPTDVPEGWGVPDLSTIESLLLGSTEVEDLRSMEGTDTPGTVVDRTAGLGSYRSALRGVRAVLIDPEQPDAPLHVLVETATSTLVRVVVESRAGSIALAWSRSPEDPTWRSITYSS